MPLTESTLNTYILAARYLTPESAALNFPAEASIEQALRIIAIVPEDCHVALPPGITAEVSTEIAKAIAKPITLHLHSALSLEDMQMIAQHLTPGITLSLNADAPSEGVAEVISQLKPGCFFKAPAHASIETYLNYLARLSPGTGLIVPDPFEEKDLETLVQACPKGIQILQKPEIVLHEGRHCIPPLPSPISRRGSFFELSDDTPRPQGAAEEALARLQRAIEGIELHPRPTPPIRRRPSFFAVDLVVEASAGGRKVSEAPGTH